MKWIELLLAVLLACLLLMGCDAREDVPSDDSTEKAECTHVATSVPGTKPTCTADGAQEGSICSLCGEVLQEAARLPATGHQYKDNICTVCGAWKESVGLVFSSNGDGTCTLIGRGDCLDDNICVPAISPEGERVTHIADHMFDGHHLRGVYLSDGIEVIGEEAFARMSELKTLRLPDTLVSIGEGAFRRCAMLTEVTVPEGVVEIPKKAFENCTKLANVSLPKSLRRIGDSAFENCNQIKTIVLPEEMQSIGANAFYECWSLEKIVIPEGVTVISAHTFFNCLALTEVILPDSLLEIGWSAFDHCVALQELQIPASVRKLDVFAFNHCKSLASIHIPQSVSEISVVAFVECPALQEICYQGTEAQWQAIKPNISSDVQMIYNCDEHE